MAVPPRLRSYGVSDGCKRAWSGGKDSISERRIRWAAVGLALTLAVGACGDDVIAGASSQYCAASVAIETAPEPDIDFESASPEEMTDAAKSYATDTLLPLAQVARDEAPEELFDELDAGIGALRQLGETGDFEAVFSDPEVEQALEDLHDYDLENCNWKTVEVTGEDFAFEGVPSELDAGVTSFEFTNAGQESHEMIVFRVNDGVTESVEQLLELPEEEAMGMVTMTAATFAEPGEDSYDVAELTPGTYAMVCFIPGGTVGETEGTGPPHFVSGMQHEFTVT